MALLNYTTQIDADRTANEIARMLSKAGAVAVMTEYDEVENYVTALSFKLKINKQTLGIKLPCDWKPVLGILEKDKKVPRRLVCQEQAVRVAWRIVKDWVEAQLAIIQTKMVKPEEVFLPYILTKDGKTFFQTACDNNFLLESGE